MKALLILSLLVATLNAEKLKPQIELVRMKVHVTNNLERHQNLQVHCKDSHEDFGVHQVPYGETYTFEFQQRGGRDDYYCGFVFDNVLHWFDIYLAERDYRYCGVYALCAWAIKENGPCMVGGASQDCYSWN